MQNLLKLSVIMAFFLAGCAGPRFETIPGSSPAKAISIVQMNIRIDGRQATTWGLSSCFHNFSLKGTNQVAEVVDRDKEFVVLKSSPGEIQLNAIACSQYMVLYNKQRNHLFKDPVSFKAEAGYINYAGRLELDYSTSGFGTADFFGAAESEADDYRVKMKLYDNYTEAQKEFLKRHGALPAGFKFKKSLMTGRTLSK